MAKLHLYQLNRPKGAEVEVPPYGVFANGASYDVDALEEDLTIGDPDEKDHIPDFKVEDQDPNPGADQAAAAEETPSDPAPVKQDIPPVAASQPARPVAASKKEDS